MKLFNKKKNKPEARELNVAAKRGSVLNGVLFDANAGTDTVLIAITGIHGNFYSNPFYYYVAAALNHAGIDFVYAQTNDAFGQIRTMNVKTQKEELIGSWNERFSYTDEDIEAYLDWAQKAGYRHIYLAASQHVVTPALENIIEANTYLSSIGFESSGLAAAHAIHDGLTVLEETHRFLHGEKVAFGTVTQLILENKPMEELSEIVVFLHKCGLPVCMKDLGIDQCSDEDLLRAAKEACAPNDTMGNMPFAVIPEDVVAAMKATDGVTEMILAEVSK